MNMKRKRIHLYTVVEVWRGIADGARSFTELEQARGYLRSARRRRNPLEDDVQLFEDTVGLASGERRRRGQSLA
jgi:hypothetical protein